MISDEMREELSAFADGEMREADARRLSNLLTRDESLRDELEAYRALSRALRAADALDSGPGPSPRLKAGALARVRAHFQSRPRRLLRSLSRPAPLAAAVLLAVCAGAALGALTSPRRSVLVASVAPAAQKPPSYRPLPSLPPVAPISVQASAKAAEARRALLEATRALEVPFGDLVARNTLGYIVLDGKRFTPASLRLYVQMLRDEARFKKERAYRATETRTFAGAPVPTVAALISPYEAKLAPYREMVILERADPVTLAGLQPLAWGKADAVDQPWETPGEVYVKNRTSHPVLLLAGDVLAGEDAAGRMRVVAGDTFLSGHSGSDFVPVVWADDQVASTDRTDLSLLAGTLGPAARRAFAGRTGRDPAFLEYFTRLPKSARPWEKSAFRPKVLQKLTAALAKDGQATGFAVCMRGRVVGVELFGSHDLLMTCADRLLRGYLAESGGALELTPVRGSGKTTLDLARDLLAGTPQRALHLVVDGKGTQDGWPKGLRRIRLLDATSHTVGEGLVLGDRPIHLTLFEQN